MIDKVCAALSIIFTILALGFVAGWASENGGPKDGGWLGKANWGGNTNHRVALLAWHPVLMVSGFFLGQVHCLVTWILFPETSKTIRQGLFWLFQTIALSFFVAAMCAVVKWKIENKYPALVTLHSWIGVIAIVVFCSNFIGAFLFQYSESFVAKYAPRFDLAFLHKFGTIFALVLASIAIIVGIVNQLGQDSCNFINDDTKAQANPAAFYDNFPNSCKVAYGCGLSVLGSTVFAVIGITITEFNPQSYKTPAQQE